MEMLKTTIKGAIATIGLRGDIIEILWRTAQTKK